MNKSGVKNNPQSNQMNRELNREHKRQTRDVCLSDSTQESTVSGEPFNNSGRKQVMDTHHGVKKVGLSSDSRNKDLITDKNPTLDHHGNRMDEHGGRKNPVDGQGNVLGTDKNFKVNPDMI